LVTAKVLDFGDACVDIKNSTNSMNKLAKNMDAPLQVTDIESRYSPVMLDGIS